MTVNPQVKSGSINSRRTHPLLDLISLYRQIASNPKDETTIVTEGKLISMLQLVFGFRTRTAMIAVNVTKRKLWFTGDPKRR